MDNDNPYGGAYGAPASLPPMPDQIKTFLSNPIPQAGLAQAVIGIPFEETDHLSFLYIQEYEKILTDIKAGIATTEDIALAIATLGSWYAKYNLKFSDSNRSYTRKFASIQASIDSATNKPMSTTKAESLAEGGEEFARLVESKVHLGNIEQYLNSIKFVLKARLSEYSNSPN